MQKTIRTHAGYAESGITPPFAKASTLPSIVTDLRSQVVVDPKAETDPQGMALAVPTSDPFLPPLSYSGLFRKVSQPYHWPEIIHPVQNLVIKEIVDQIVEKISSLNELEYPYYLDTLYQYALHYDYAEEKLREVAENNLRAQKLLKTLVTTASTPSKAP